MRFPRPCRYVARRFIFACEFTVGQAASGNLGHGQLEAVGIFYRTVCSGAIVVTENLFVYVTEQMKRLDSNVGSTKAALQQRPEVLQAVRVYATVNILFRMVHNVVNEVVAHLVVAYGIIRVDRRAVLDVAQKHSLCSAPR